MNKALAQLINQTAQKRDVERTQTKHRREINQLKMKLFIAERGTLQAELDQVERDLAKAKTAHEEAGFRAFIFMSRETLADSLRKGAIERELQEKRHMLVRHLEVIDLNLWKLRNAQ